MQILLVDDDPTSVEILRRAVEAAGFSCLTATNGEEAWRLFQDHEPQVVLSDWVMPEVDGIELLHRVRSHDAPRLRYTYFIIITSLSDDQYRLQGMLSGADDYMAKPIEVVGLRLRLIVAQRVSKLHHRLMEQASELERLNERLYEDGRRDPLTRVGNRLRLDEDLEVVHALAERYGHSYTLAMFDIDHFKAYNDANGHMEGDVALQHVTEALVRQCRKGDRIYRYGGEELVAVFQGQHVEGTGKVTERMRAAVEALDLPNPGAGEGARITVSCGIAGHTADSAGLDPVQILRRADAALYAAKDEGRNIVVQWDPELGG